MNEHQQKIESLLFFKNQPVSYTWLSRVLGISIGNTKDEVNEMIALYADRGIELIITEDDVSLVTNRSQEEAINSLRTQEAAKELSKQALETLAIVLFKGKISKPEIDFIRGVNSVYILRNLMIRGLVDKKTNPQDRRSPLYIPTLDLLAFLGVNQVKELSGYQDFTQKFSEIHQQYLKETLQELQEEKKLLILTKLS